MREAEKEKAELAAVLAMQSQDVEGTVSGLREVGEEHTEYIQEGEDIDLDSLLGPSVPYERAMSPEPFDTLSREDQDLEVVDQWEDWAEIVSFSAAVVRFVRVSERDRQKLTSNSGHRSLFFF